MELVLDLLPIVELLISTTLSATDIMIFLVLYCGADLPFVGRGKREMYHQNCILVLSLPRSSKVGRGLEKTANFRQKIVISLLLLHLRW